GRYPNEFKVLDAEIWKHYECNKQTEEVYNWKMEVRNRLLAEFKPVPIIKMALHPPYQELDLDINVNNTAGIYNSHLIHYYSLLDQRFPAVCLLVKHWAITNGIGDAATGSFNRHTMSPDSFIYRVFIEEPFDRNNTA
ncbi:hypothetical protein OSTOST_23716, partial [Ostertagia ostertagi]